MECKICNNSNGLAEFEIKEKMFGLNESFSYFICPTCKCMQIIAIPDDLSRYYPQEYYSFEKKRKKPLKKSVKQSVFICLSLLKGRYHKKPAFAKFGIEFKEYKKKILDIGSGNGRLLYLLKDYGFKNLTGIDPFINEDIKDGCLKLIKKDYTELSGRYDIIMSHHSLEHMPDPNLFFNSIVNLLEQKGRLILRIPIYPNFIWDKYGVGWIQLDAPRHLFTFSIKSIEVLCEKYNLIIQSVKYDCQPWALASTEFCLNGKTHKEFERNIQISENQIEQTRNANENNYGDSAMFIIVKK